MKIQNKFDMLDAMSDINEEYVRKADRLLMRHKTGGSAVKMEITPVKFSWKSVIAAAACLALLVGAAFGIKALIDKPEIVKPADILTPAQQAYLDEWKEKLDAKVNAAFAVDRLNFIEILPPYDENDLDIDIKYFIDENRAVFIREKKVDDKFEKTLEIYDLTKRTCSVIARLDPEDSWTICYADSDYVLYQRYGDSGEALHIYDVNSELNKLIYKDSSGSARLLFGRGDKTAADGKVYFTAYDGVTGEPSLYVYEIESGARLDVVEGAGNPRKYKDDIIFACPENDQTYTRSFSGKYDFPGSVIVTKYGLYQMEDYGYGGLFELETNREIFPRQNRFLNYNSNCDFALRFGGTSLSSYEAAKNDLKFLYYAPTDEILVFQDGDGFGLLDCFGWGALISKTEPDGSERYFLVTDKETENAVKIPKLDVQPDNDDPESYLDKMKELFGFDGNADYAHNKLGIKTYDISEFEGLPVLIDENHSLVTVRDSEGIPEVRMYDITSNDYRVIHSRADDPKLTAMTDITVWYANSDYAVLHVSYDGTLSYEMRIIELAALDWHDMQGPKAVTNRRMVIDGDVMYFTMNGDVAAENDAIYRYKINGGKESEQVASGKYLALYDGKIYYISTKFTVGEQGGYGTSEYALCTLNGGNRVFVHDHLPALGKYGVFARGTDNSIVDVYNGTEIVSGGNNDLTLELYDFLLLMKDEKSGTAAFYDVNTGELLVFDDEDEDIFIDTYLFEFDGGMYAVKRESGSFSKLYVITEKGSQAGIKPKPDPKPEQPQTEKNYTSNVPEGELSELMNISSEYFTLPEKINGCSYHEMGFADRSRLRVVLTNDKNEYIEYGVYKTDTGSYLTLLDQRDDPKSSAFFAQCGNYVYCEGKNSLWIAADIAYDPNISKCKVFELGKGLYSLDKYNHRGDGMALAPDGTIYFNAFDREPVYDEYLGHDMSYSQSALYRFDPSTGETEKVLDGAFAPRQFGGDILYDVSEPGVDGGFPRTLLKSLSGNISLYYDDYFQPSSNFRSGIIVCGDKIFGLKCVDPYDWNKDKQLINALTGEVILQTNEITAYAVTDNIIQIYTYEKGIDTSLLYFINENKLVRVKKGDVMHDGIIYDYNGFGVIGWTTGLTRDGKLYTFSMK